MKRYIFLITAVLLAFLISGCGSSAAKVRSRLTQVQTQIPSVGEVIDQVQGNGSSEEPEGEAEPEGDTSAPESSGEAEPEENEKSSEEVEERLTDPSLTVGDLKAMGYSVIKTRAAYLINQFMNNTVPKNSYSNLSFHHDGSLLRYEEPGVESLLGVDVSVFQGEIDWAAVRDQGISFAIIRVGFRGYGESGSLNEDELFRQNIAGAREAGLLVGAYFFSQAVTVEEAREEAGYVLSLLDGITLDLPVVFDEEIIKDDTARTDQMTLSQFNENALAFFEVIEAAGYTPMLYTNLLFECLIYDLEQFSGIPVWFAGYEPLPLSPYHFDIWQYTESGTLDGIEGPVDLNIWIRRT